MIVTLEDIKVMYVESSNGPAGAVKAFMDLESRLPSIKGRKFYGTYQHQDGPYRACVAITDDDDPAALGLKTRVIPGGKYAREKLENYRDRIPEIGRKFAAMTKENNPDQSRPGIEFYKSSKELLLFLPVK